MAGIASHVSLLTLSYTDKAEWAAQNLPSFIAQSVCLADCQLAGSGERSFNRLALRPGDGRIWVERQHGAHHACTGIA